MGCLELSWNVHFALCNYSNICFALMKRSVQVQCVLPCERAGWFGARGEDILHACWLQKYIRHFRLQNCFISFSHFTDSVIFLARLHMLHLATCVLQRYTIINSLAHSVPCYIYNFYTYILHIQRKVNRINTDHSTLRNKLFNIQCFVCIGR